MKNIAIFTSFFKVEQNMSGMGYRAWEFAQVLSKYHKVNLVLPRESDFKTQKNITFTVLDESNCEEIVRSSDVIFALPEVNNDVLIAASKMGKVIISDITYNPIEALEKDSMRLSEEKDDKYQIILDQYKIQLLLSDLIIVESHEQRLFMLGALMALDRVEFNNYMRSIDFSHLITEIPVGFNKYSLNKVNKQRSSDDNSEKLLLWNGGIWNHYDPTPIIKAMNLVTKKDPGVKLMFMYCSPTKLTTDAKMAIDLSKKLGLYNKNIFFNEDAINYKERDRLLLSAKCIVCANPYAIDAMIMRRLRFRDSLLYTLPMLTTSKGSLPDVIEKFDIGYTFENENVEDIAKKILTLVNDKKRFDKLKENLVKVQSKFLMENNMKELLRFIKANKKAPDTKYSQIADKIKRI